ncbi:ABC transporter permease [Fluviispira sanaruensis]|uniref:ABC transporter permease n=1 Tax=Fluviispira sanaruensis TaxID=2493639 RepID=A0A4P2VQ29_FLUSA|nr:ABC-2 family transporter protein [Fluviispira sanaruensis]BBH54364.1 hypothetical protein JCM31447_28280 [Fluviispira sanaruensis]
MRKINFLKMLRTIIMISFANSIVFRGTFLLRFFVILASLSAYYYFWLFVYRQNSTIANYDFSSFIGYLVGAQIFYSLLQPDDINMSDSIRYGELDKYLLLPSNMILILYLKLLGNRLAYATTIFIPFLLLIIFSSLFFNTHLFRSISLLQILSLGFFCLGGVSLHFLMEITIGLLAFWFEKSDFLFVVKEMIFWILAGLWLPYEFFPSALQTIFQWSPFRYFAYIQATILTGKAHSIAQELILMVFWIIAFIVLTILIMKKGIKKYEAFGS